MYDYLLIGHGIAGAILARALRARRRRVLVYDDPRPDTASRVAAGLMNPVAGKRFALTWRAPDTLPYAVAYYKNLSAELGEDLFQESLILKVFGSAQEQQQVLARAAENPWGEFLERIETGPLTLPGVVGPHGGAWLRGGGHLRVEATLAALARQGRAAGWLREEVFQWENLVAEDGGVIYAPAETSAAGPGAEPVRARRVVCCQGAAALASPYFDWLPLTPNRGAVLDVAAPGLSAGQVLNRGAYVVPGAAAGQFRVGATYRWPPFAEADLAGQVAADLAIDNDDRRELRERLAALTGQPFEVLGERRGTRPAVRDRRPLLGRHPDPALPWLSFFGGFGSKGVSLAPRLAALLADHLETGAELWPDATLARYLSLFPPPVNSVGNSALT